MRAESESISVESVLLCAEKAIFSAQKIRDDSELILSEATVFSANFFSSEQR